jgi:DNA-binding response OmpR family regulator
VRRILAVDEFLALRKLIQRVLEQEDGYHVEMAANADDALSLLQASDFDVAFIDAELSGMNGLELGKKLREIKPSLQVVFMSNGFKYVDEALALKFRVLLKPYKNEEIKYFASMEAEV